METKTGVTVSPSNLNRKFVFHPYERNKAALSWTCSPTLFPHHSPQKGNHHAQTHSASRADGQTRRNGFVAKKLFLEKSVTKNFAATSRSSPSLWSKYHPDHESASLSEARNGL
jgi:hypothetical protein